MKLFIAALVAAALSLPVLAQDRTLVADLGGGNTLVLKRNQLCENADILAAVRFLRGLSPDVPAPRDFLSAGLMWNGAALEACWSVLSTQYVFVVDETGDFGAVPLSQFTLSNTF
jgi:hypothetical protein